MTPTHSNTSIVARNTLYQFIGKIVIVLFSMATFTLIARALSVEQYGYFTLISTIFALMMGFADLRVEQIAIREAATDEQRLPQLAGQSLIIKLLFSILILLIAIPVIWFSSYPQLVKVGASLVMGGVLLNALQASFVIILQYRLQAHFITLAEVIAKIFTTIMVALTVVPIVGGQASSSAFHVYTLLIILLVVAPSLVWAMYLYLVKFKQKTAVTYQLDRTVIIDIFKQSLPLWVLGILSLIHYRADTIILASLQSAYDVGIYGLPYRLMDVAITLPPLITASVYPVLSRHAATDRQRADRAIANIFSIMLIAALTIALIMYYAAPQLVTMFGGQQYAASINVLRILSLALISSYLASVFVPYLIAFRRQSVVIMSLLVSVMVNIALAYLLIPGLSYTGAAIATATSELLDFILIFLFMVLILKVPISWAKITKTLLIVVATYFILWLTNLNSITGNMLTSFSVAALIALLATSLIGLGTLKLGIIEPHLLHEMLRIIKMPPLIRRLLVK